MMFYSSLLQLGFGIVVLLPTVSAGGSGCCKFTLSSKGSFSCPAGELSDGQIRLNGSEPESTFCIDSNGGITDQNGFGCIVTAAPITQVQCNANTAPDDSFSIDSSGNLEYKGSSSFYACPATDTEYNVYVSPNFGQSKCFQITLQASGCTAQTSSSSACVASTVTSTITQLQTITGSASTVTETATNSWTQTFDLIILYHNSVMPDLQHDIEHQLDQFYKLLYQHDHHQHTEFYELMGQLYHLVYQYNVFFELL